MANADPSPSADTERIVHAWVALISQLDRTHAAASCGSPARSFGTFGTRRRDNACRRLLQERQRIARELCLLGLDCLADPRHPEEVRGGGLWPGHDGLRVEFASLALAYDRCARLSDRLHQSSLQHWLAERARMHQEHVMFLGL